MKITRIEVDNEMYVVVKASNGSTYCEECDLESKCIKKDEETYPCNIVGEEDIFKKECDQN